MNADSRIILVGRTYTKVALCSQDVKTMSGGAWYRYRSAINMRFSFFIPGPVWFFKALARYCKTNASFVLALEYYLFKLVLFCLWLLEQIRVLLNTPLWRRKSKRVDEPLPIASTTTSVRSWRDLK